MNDCLKCKLLCGLRKDQGTESFAVDCATFVSNRIAEFRDNLVKTWRALGNRLAGKFVGIDLNGPEFAPARGYGRFSSCDATG